MSSPHFIVFVGANAALSTELNILRESYEGMEVIAPATPKSELGISDHAIHAAFEGLEARLKGQSCYTQPARLTVWAYRPIAQAKFARLWESFGKAGWIELVPNNLLNKIRPTRMHIQSRIDFIHRSLHHVSHQIYNRRMTTPFPLPLGNFKSKIALDLSQYWYREATSIEALVRIIEKNCQRFRQLHSGPDRTHRDDRDLIFSPAKATECHGIPHPIGDGRKCFVDGRFRFGAALFPGFHYDVRSKGGKLNCVLVNCDGAARSLGPERRDYINVFPNDHLLPDA